jgi:hypothetical protein
VTYRWGRDDALDGHRGVDAARSQARGSVRSCARRLPTVVAESRSRGGRTGELDQALAAAARALDPLSFKLRRTRYRSGPRYIVPYTDEHGRDRPREFETLAQAHEFTRALRIAHQARQEIASGSITRGADQGGGVEV